MSSHFNEATYRNANIEIPASAGVLSSLTDEQHSDLLDYLNSRLSAANQDRNVRLTRYAKIDRLISTWMKLSADDSQREEKEDLTGRTQALPMNLPLLATHLEDMVSFFAEVYAPTGRDFYVTPPKENSDAAKELAKKMNRDTKARKYYKELCSTLRALIKYNIGGFAVRWEEGGGFAQMAEPGNRIESIDMYNYLYDPSITDISKVASEAEYAARISNKSQMWLVRKALKGELERVDKVILEEKGRVQDQSGKFMNRMKKEASYYRLPPSHAGLASDGSDTRTSSDTSGQPIDWAAYGAKLAHDEKPDIMGFEVAEMYCWLNPKEFGLVPKETQAGLEGSDAKGNGYALYRFVVIDACQVCRADPIVGVKEEAPEIPHYLSFLTHDDMKEAQRSIMEMMRGFQRFGSFLMNIFVAGARKNIWGTKIIDPSMLDTSELEQGDVAPILKSKVAGRDVRTGFLQTDSNAGVGESFTMLTQMMEIVRLFYPSQGLPAQVAGIDRAIGPQVAAVMQGSVRRLHMLCKLLDVDLMGPTRIQCYKNLSVNDAAGLENLTEEVVAKVLGSGLEHLNAEKAAAAIQAMIFALFQNPDSMATFDMPGLMTYWSRLQNSPSDLGDFVRTQPQPTPEAPAVPVEQ